MQNKGWIKLHRKILLNKGIIGNPNRLAVLMALLLMADHKTGELVTGRIFLSGLLGLDQSAVYRALRWLQNENVLVLKPNNKNTHVIICNWHKYQETPNINRTSIEHQSNTYKNEELRTKNTNKKKIIKRKAYDRPVRDEMAVARARARSRPESSVRGFKSISEVLGRSDAGDNN